MEALLEALKNIKLDVIEKFNYVKYELAEYWIEHRRLRCYRCKEITGDNYSCNFCHEVVCEDCSCLTGYICNYCESRLKLIEYTDPDKIW